MSDREWIVDGNLGGYIDENGKFIVCEEYGLSDVDTDKYFIEVMNGDGYYNSFGRFVRYNNGD